MNQTKKQQDWLKLKAYQHFSPKLKPIQKGYIRDYVQNDQKIITHRFYPFIHVTINQKRFKRETKDGVRSKTRTAKTKKREIFYANHLDAQVFAYYSHLINSELDLIYKCDLLLHNSVIAYRGIEHNKHRNKCNIDFAHEVFSFIKKSQSNELVALCFDVDSFFDSLDHKILKEVWSRILKLEKLPLDHYKVFKAITKYSYVDFFDIKQASPTLQKIKKIAYLRNKSIDRLLTKDEFRENIQNKGKIKVNRIFKGIPQGSPISATLSNLYLLEFDKKISSLLANVDGLYRRYSDDIIVICPGQHAEELKEIIMTSIDNDFQLKIQPSKTQQIHFRRQSIHEDWIVENQEKIKNAVLSYLGFDFDGKHTRIRQEGLSSYYRTIKRLIRRKAFYARCAKRKNEGNTAKKLLDEWIYVSKIYRTKSHLGARRKRIGNKVYWGNYISYAYTAAKIMNEKAIRKQVRNHWKIIETMIRRMEKKYDLPRSPSRKKK